MILTLSYRPPYQWEPLISFLRARAIPGVETVSDSTYRRSIAVGGDVGVIEVSRSPDGSASLVVKVQGIRRRNLVHVTERVRRMFGLDADPLLISRHLSRDRRLAPVVKAAPGLRIPVVWHPFEAAVRALLGQQISVAAAVRLVGRLVEIIGTRLPSPTKEGIESLFPTPEAVADGDLGSLRVPGARRQSLIDLSREIASGNIRFEGYETVGEVTDALEKVHGIGPWSAEYIALRGLGDPDAFPETDLGIRKALQRLGYNNGPEELASAIDRWRPWRGYAALYLWNSNAVT